MIFSLEATREFVEWDRLGAYLREDDLLLIPDEDRLKYLRSWQDISEQEDKLDDALLIGLIGGTGVGKSTFINALAGKEISRSSDRRPTTDRIVVYRHVTTELPDDLPTTDFAQPQVLHERQELIKAMLFDFPDFDSVERTHHAIIQRYVGFLDVLLVVVDDVKYADRRLYELLSSINHDAANLFVLFNKIDRLENRYEEKTEDVVEELCADVRQKLADNAGLVLTPAQVFPIAAKTVLDARVAGQEVPPDELARFAKVEQLLASFQHEKHRRAAKERNIDVRKTRLVGELAGNALGTENESILQDTAQMIRQWREQIEDTLRGIPVEVLSDRDRRSLYRQRLRRAGRYWGLPFSLLFTLVFELRRSRFQSPSSELSAVGARIFQHYRGFFEAIGNLRARFESELRGSTIDAALQEVEAAPVDQAIAKEQLSDELAADFQRHLSHREQRPRTVTRLACHLPALGTLTLAIWSRVYPVLESVSGQSERGVFGSLVRSVIGTLSPTFVIATILGVIIVYALTAVFIWLREVQLMEADIHDAELAVREMVARRGGRVVDELEQRVSALQAEFDRLGRLLT